MIYFKMKHFDVIYFKMLHFNDKIFKIKTYKAVILNFSTDFLILSRRFEIVISDAINFLNIPPQKKIVFSQSHVDLSLKNSSILPQNHPSILKISTHLRLPSSNQLLSLLVVHHLNLDSEKTLMKFSSGAHRREHFPWVNGIMDFEVLKVVYVLWCVSILTTTIFIDSHECFLWVNEELLPLSCNLWVSGELT